ncbi:MAG: domain protein transpeptidase [Streptosporangiaceae bacterium]|jgi:cell division protein FtsI/penicillin-binding protein 2|nr:domain protein transpeptidase [Streptosporangiaceae bacterium]
MWGKLGRRKSGGSSLGGRPGPVRRVIAAGAVAMLVASGTSACFAEPSVLPTVRDFLIAWQVGAYHAAAKRTTGDPAVVEAALAQLRGQLDAASLRLRMGQIRKQGDQATARFEVKVDLGENGEPWQYLGQMNLRRVNGDWKIVWSPTIIHPSLSDGERLAIVTESPKRATVQDAGGRALLRMVRADVIGVYPGALRSPDRTIKQLAQLTRLDSERLIGRVRSAPPNEFLPLLMLQQPDHAVLTMRLREIPGLVFHPANAPIAPLMAADLVGTLGPATAQRLQEVGAPYQPGDTIGVSGLQLLYQRRLAGIPAVRVVLQDIRGKRQVLREWSGQPSSPVRTTLDRAQQLRAEYALSDLRVPASLVAVHQATGEILAVANHGAANRNLAMQGDYPPGMAFGIVSAEALLAAGVNSKADCPASTTVGGQTITNAGRPRPGKSNLQMNFAYSCTTTLAGLSTKMDANTLMREAGRFGLGKDWGLPVPASSGTVPRPADDGAKANVMIGQGGVRVSPLSMALVAGAAASGTWRPPRLLNTPPVPQTLQPQPLDPAPFRALRPLLRRSVYEGTAKAAEVKGGATVYGVAATVKYNEGGRPKTVSWFVGFRGDVAFAVAIEGPISASQVAHRFLTARPPAA